MKLRLTMSYAIQVGGADALMAKLKDKLRMAGAQQVGPDEFVFTMRQFDDISDILEGAERKGEDT